CRFSFFSLLLPPPPISPLFPYTTLFRSDARGESLDDVRDPHAMGTAVPEEFLHLFRHEVAEDHADVRDARFSKVIEAVQDVRLVRERDQLLWARVRERSKPGPVAPRQDEPLHPDTPDLN